MKTGIELIAEERQRQIYVEGFSKDHDAEHTDKSILGAAICYAEISLVGKEHCVYNFPWRADEFKPSTYIKNLIKSGALIAAEIDRISTIENYNKNKQLLSNK